MSWPVALVYGYLLLAIELVIPAELRLGSIGAAPSFVIPFVVFVAMFAEPMGAYWTAILIGLALDMTTPRDAFVIAGPYALGLFAAAYLIVTLRTAVNRNALALIVFSMGAATLCAVVVVAIFTIRSWYTPQITWHAGDELTRRLLSAFYTGASAAVLSLVLFPSQGLFRFHDPYTRRAATRSF
jgi:hypothetical protein